MKIRDGFVTNSSSTCFVVIFDHMPACSLDLQKMLFGDDKVIDCYDDDPISTKEVAEFIYDEMSGQTPNDINGLSESVAHLLEGAPGQNDFIGLDGEQTGFYDDAVQEFGRKFMQRILDEDPSRAIFHFRFSDNVGGVEAVAKSAGVFERLKHYAF